MNDRSRMMLYALTAVACVIWIWQSAKEAMADGTMISTSNIIFLVCIGVAAVYCAANALILWWRQPSKEDAENDDAADTPDGTDTDTADAEDPRTTPMTMSKPTSQPRMPMHHQPLIASNHRYRSPESSESSHFSKGTLWK